MIGSDLEMMRKRYDFLSELVKDYKSVDNFFEEGVVRHCRNRIDKRGEYFGCQFRARR